MTDATSTNQSPATDDDWRTKLTDEQYRVLREAGTERPFTGEYVNNKEDGTYKCAGCGTELFSSDTKYNSGSGWPSFTAPADQSAIAQVTDTSHGMRRIEARCATCEGHLGHVFEDGPSSEGGMRYCINSAALDFEGQANS